MAQWPKYSATRYDELGLSQCEPKLWRFVATDHDKGKSPHVVGPFYKTKGEAMGDLERYYSEAWAGSNE